MLNQTGVTLKLLWNEYVTVAVQKEIYPVVILDSVKVIQVISQFPRNYHRTHKPGVTIETVWLCKDSNNQTT